MQAFYDSLGGIVGYQLKCLELIIAARAEELSDAENGCSSGDAAESDHVEYLIPQGPNLQGAQGREVAQRAAADGLRAMPQLAEIYPLGGAPRLAKSTSQISLRCLWSCWCCKHEDVRCSFVAVRTFFGS